MPWRAEREAPPSSAPPYVGDSPLVGEPLLPVLDVTYEYTLVELIDVAQRSNPETRQAWLQARAAAARLGYPAPTGPFAVEGPY